MPEGVRGRRRCRRQQLVGAVLAAAAVAAGSAAPVTADSGPLLLARILPRTREARASTAALAEGLCGGSLVHENWVLTAAQCAHESLVGAAVVRLGDEDRAVQKVVAHPEYHDGDDEAHDIALIELGPSVVAQTAPAVTLVNIMDPGLESVNSTLSLVGSEDAAAVVTAERCADEAADRMCASGPSADLVGAPLLNVASDKGRPPLQVGIATSCASRGAHAALNEYTRVRSYVKWIQSAAQIRLASLLDVEVQRQRELQFIDTNTPYPTTSQSSGSSSVEEDDAGDSPTAYPTPAPPPTSRPTEAPTPKSTPKPTEAPTTAKPTPFPTMSPTPKPTAAPTATPTVVVAMSTPAPTFYTTDLNPFDCYIFEGNPGYEKDLQGCQLPFQYKGWQGETLDFDYPPTIAEARPFGVDQLAGVAAGDTTMRWCPTVGVLTYNVDKKNRKVKWGVVYCGKPQFLPTPEPTPAPTKLPTAKPTERPTRKPTQRPTNKPTAKPTNAPTAKPTKSPTRAPTPRPTEAPTPAPTTEEFHVRDLFCMTFGTDIDDCSDGDWHDNQCTWLEGVCRARVMPTARPTMTPTQAPTSPDVVSGSAGNGDASGEDGVDMSTIIIIAGSLAGVTVIVLAVSLTMVRKRRRAGKSDPSVAMTAFTGTSGDGPYSGGNQYPGARQYPGGSQYPGGAPPPSSRPSPAAMVGNVPSYLSDFGARASTRMGNLRGFFSSSASTPSEAPSYQVSTPQSVQAGSANPHPAFRRYDTYDSYESEMAPPPPPPTPAMPSGPSRGFAAGAPGSGMDAAPPPPPPLPARPGMRPPPGLGFVNKFSSRFSRFQQ